jgi:hypothetical protein
MKKILFNCWRVLCMPVSLVLGTVMFFWIALVNLGFKEAGKFWREWVF